jgi:predicted signal transduction protein with EAL and GGDEF domain
LVAVFYGLYFSVRVILLAMFVVAGASPMLYEPDLLGLLEFLVVPLPLHLTVALVCNYVVRRAERQEQARAVSEARLLRERERGERLRRESEMDGLTGISNRRRLEGRLDEELERAERLGERFALLFADLDGFKAVNDDTVTCWGTTPSGSSLARSRRTRARSTWSPAAGARSSWSSSRAPRPKGSPPSTSGHAGTCSNVRKRSSGFPCA